MLMNEGESGFFLLAAADDDYVLSLLLTTTIMTMMIVDHLINFSLLCEGLRCKFSFPFRDLQKPKKKSLFLPKKSSRKNSPTYRSCNEKATKLDEIDGFNIGPCKVLISWQINKIIAQKRQTNWP